MKKTLAAAITSALVIGVASTTFAAANPFSDVPTDHWSFDAVAKLAHEGVIEGYGDNTFRGDAKITRYEMAQMVAKAMTKSNVSAADKATIDKLSAEYATELNNLGVRVSNLESKVDNVKFTGKLRLRSTQTDNEGLAKSTASQSYFELWTTAQINKDWQAVTETEITKDTTSGVDGAANLDGNDTQTTAVYVQGPLFGTQAKIGKIKDTTVYGYVIDDTHDAAQFSFGNKLKTRLTFGDVNEYGPTSNINPNKTGGSADYAALELAYNTSKVTNINAAYFKLNSTEKVATNEVDNNIYTIGLTTNVAKNLKFDGLYVKSDAEAAYRNEGVLAQLTYKAADKTKPGSFDIYTAYRNVPKYSYVSTTWGTYQENFKGMEYGFDYVLDKNIQARVFYFDAKKIDTVETTHKVVRGQVEFFF